MISVFSENPENDLWRELLQFSYEANINRYLSKKGLHANGETINCIVGSFLQADEYYRAAKDANLQISPLLLYYGTTNLLYGMVNLLSGRKNIIANHGMKIFVPEHMSFIADTTIRFLSPSDGGVHVIARAIGFSQDLTNFGDWSLSEFLDSIAEISSDFIQCYEVNAGRVAMLEGFNTPDGKMEKIYFSEENKDQILALLQDVEGFDKSYLRLSVGKERETSKGYFILRHKLTGKDIPRRSKRHIACSDFLCFARKVRARSFCCSSFPPATRFAGLAGGGRPCGRLFFVSGRNIGFNRSLQKKMRLVLTSRIFF